MPITFAIAKHQAKEISLERQGRIYKTQQDIAARLSSQHVPAKVLQGSIDHPENHITRSNGFVYGSLMAYNQHHNLIIRPDDIWIAILSQLSFYINAHAEELRNKFVSHEGKKKLIVVSDSFDIEGMDFGNLSIQMTDRLHENIKDESLIPWALPDFSTTTANDSVICSVTLMSTFKKWYFDYEVQTLCGIPFITLEGTQSDWQSILNKIDKIPEFGDQPKQWAAMLRPILHRFVRAFDIGGQEADSEFWERILHHEKGSGVNYISGWMTAFCAWDPRGVFFRHKNEQGSRDSSFTEAPDWVHNLTFDGAWFPRVRSVPDGFVEVDVNVVDTVKGETHDCTMVAGHVGVSIDVNKPDTLRFAPQWLIFVKGKEKPNNSF